MRRALGNILLAGGLLLATAAIAQISLPWPGPGNKAGALPCTANTQNGGTFANVVSLYHFDNNGTESKGGTRTLTLNAPGSYSSAQSKFGGFSIFSSGGSAGAGTATAAAGFGPPATVEFWIQWASVGSSAGLISGLSFYIYWDGTNLSLKNTGGNTAGFAFTPVAGVWYAMAWQVDSSNNAQMYLNGVAQNPTGQQFFNTFGGGTATVLSASSASGQTANMTGYMDELRVSNIIRYTANYTPATNAFCNN